MSRRIPLAAFLFALLPSMLQAASAGAVEFRLRDLDGNTRSLDQYRGKWIVINFWATWCPPCLEEIPELVAFHEDHQGRDAVVLGVNYERIRRGRLQRFVDEYFITYPVLPLSPGSPTPFGTIVGLPMTFIVDPEGRLVARQTGTVTAEMLEEYIRQRTNRSVGR